MYMVYKNTSPCINDVIQTTESVHIKVYYAIDQTKSNYTMCTILYIHHM